MHPARPGGSQARGQPAGELAVADSCEGRCLDMPAEPAGTPLLDEVHQTAYPAQELGGLIFVYMGPDPAPLLPRYDVMVRDDCSRLLRAGIDHCNWLQRIENGHDPAHLGILHAAGYPQIAMTTLADPVPSDQARGASIASNCHCACSMGSFGSFVARCSCGRSASISACATFGFALYFARMDAVLAFAKAARKAGAQRFLLVSALGADPRSRIFYNRVKGETEEHLQSVGFESLVLLRPSLLLGERAESRPGERVAIVATKVLGPLLRPLSSRPIEARTVARAMLALAQSSSPGVRVVPSGELHQLGK